MNTNLKNVLIVDDDIALGRMCIELFQSRNYKADATTSGEDALELLEKNDDYGVVLTDLIMPGGMDGIEFLKKVKQRHEGIAIVVMTSYGTVDNAVEAMKLGASDYITKPLKRDVLIHTIERILRMKALESEIARLRLEVEGKYNFENILGESYKMQRIYDLIASVSDTDANVLISGETGTGKELVAKTIHYNSPRKDKPFIKVDCASLTETLLESEFFGHERGAFTGATRDRMGRFRMADEGTIFLDEIGNIPLSVQAKLLRVLQDKEFEPVGSDETVRVDVRTIAATNVDLRRSLENQKFRSDLFYRLNVVSIHLPPLRERIEDIPILVTHFLVKYREKNKKNIENISQGALNKLMSYDWPGNVRELENLIERSVILCKGPILMADDMPLLMGRGAPVATDGHSLREAMDIAEKQIILDALNQTGWNKDLAVKRLGISRASIYNKINKYNIKKEAKILGNNSPAT